MKTFSGFSHFHIFIPIAIGTDYLEISPAKYFTVLTNWLT